MILFATIFILSGISYIDFRTHRIPNRLTFVLFIVTLINPDRAPYSVTLAALAIVALTFLLLKIGMGDLKLAWVLIINQGAIILTSEYLGYFLLGLLVTIALTMLRRGSLTGSIAFAPVIALPYLACHLAI